jgi:uncharacterized membrane protein YgaE (UPF0421/DUF939 family)
MENISRGRYGLKLKKIGMRTIKTGIGVFITALIGSIGLLQEPLYAAIACVVTMQNTVKGSLKAGTNRIKGTVVGAIIGYLFALVHPGDPILTGVGIIALIYICNILNIKQSVSIASVVFCSILLGVGNSNVLLYSINRTIDTAAGIVIALVVNYFIIRPNYLKDVMNELKIIEKRAIELIKEKIIYDNDIDIDNFNEEIVKLESIYQRFIDELEYRNEDIEIEKLKKTLDVCKEIYFHLQSITLLNDKCYLSNKNHEGLKKLYKKFELRRDIDDEESPVFNYHLGMIIKEIIILHNVNELME